MAYNGRQRGFTDVSTGIQVPEGEASTDHILYPYRDWKVSDTFDTETICFKYADLNARDIRVNSFPPPTVTRSATQPSAPQASTVSAPQPRLQDNRRTDDGDRRHDDGDRRKKKKSSSGKKIRKFFKELFDEGQVDPSQAPIGESGSLKEPAPVDNKVKLDFNEQAPTQAVDKKDRSELIKLRVPPKIPEEWIKLNNLDVNEVRALEAKEQSIIESLNKVFGYISPSALWNQVDKVATLAKSGVKKFEATFTSVVVSVESSVEEAAQNAFQAVSNIHARVKWTLGFNQLQNIKKVEPKVVKLIGAPAFNTESASNPFRERHIKSAGEPTASTTTAA